MVTIKCTNYCGFSVTGEQDWCQEVYDDHDHQDEPGTLEGAHWYEHVFSIWGLFMLVAIAGIVETILRAR